jgi:diguanylate cyclase (GGDEF)-like protein
VLIVDDQRLHRELLRALLEDLNHEVREAVDGEAALAAVAAEEPDLIFLDIAMPKLDGLEVCRRLKADPTLRLIPVVLLTARNDDATKLKGIEAGADDFLTKPFNAAELLVRTKVLLRDRRLNVALDGPDAVILADHVHDGVAIYDQAGRLVYWNVAAMTITGWRSANAEATSFRERPAGLAEIRPGKWIESRRVMLPWDRSPAEAILFNDVTAQRRLADTQQQLRDIGLIDPLTGLIGERLFRDHARRAIELARRDARPAGLIWIDLDRFIGPPEAHAVADAVMRECARKVEGTIRVSDVAARPEPESLAVMLTALRSSAELRVIAVRLQLVLATPCFVEGRGRSVATALGGAVFPDDGDEPGALISAARRAARQGSRAGGQLVMAGES